MHQNKIRLLFRQNLPHAEQYPAGHIVQILPRFHDIQVAIRYDVE